MMELRVLRCENCGSVVIADASVDWPCEDMDKLPGATRGKHDRHDISRCGRCTHNTLTDIGGTTLTMTT